MKKILEECDRIVFDVNEKNQVVVERYFRKYTQRDVEIHSKPIPKHPRWLYLIISAIRFYQNNISQKLGNRCVFDPSCSHYSESAFRKHGFINGLQLTIKRLRKCTPENGGVYELE